jgi:hypothetical protein
MRSTVDRKIIFIFYDKFENFVAAVAARFGTATIRKISDRHRKINKYS